MSTLVETPPSALRQRRWPSAVAAMLLLVATAATALATYLFWLPCRGNMTRGLIFVPDGTDAAIPESCLLQMDSGTPFPYAADDALYPTAGPVLAAVAMAAAGLAWLALVMGARWRPRTTAVALLPGLLSLGLAVSSARAAGSGAHESAYASTTWWVLPEAAAVGVLFVVRLWEPQLSDREIARLAVILWGVTAFGASHFVVDYMTMTTLNSWNWDCPPGSGYPTALAIGVAAALTAGRARTQ
jgi:hypothetical protein